MEIRKFAVSIEETLIEGFKAVEKPVRIAAAMAVIKNPYAGRYVEDLKSITETYSGYLGSLLPDMAIKTLGVTGEDVEAFGKGALVGLDGEIEHGSAIIHSLAFGNPFRKMCGNAASYLPSAEKRGAAGSPIDMAIKHKMDTLIRSHHMSFEVRISDAPRLDEIVVIAAVAISGRAHPRIGSAYEELKAEAEKDLIKVILVNTNT